MLTTFRQLFRLFVLAAIFVFACLSCLASSLVGRSDEELLQIMVGGQAESRLRDEAKIKTRVPERFWDMAPKDAALALVRENCPTELRQAFEFIFDVRENTRLPAKGEVGIRWRCAHCYIVDEGDSVIICWGESALSDLMKK